MTPDDGLERARRACQDCDRSIADAAPYYASAIVNAVSATEADQIAKSLMRLALHDRERAEKASPEDTTGEWFNTNASRAQALAKAIWLHLGTPEPASASS